MPTYKLLAKSAGELTNNEHASINNLVLGRLESDGVGVRAATREAYVRQAETARRDIASAIGGRLLRSKQAIADQTFVLMYDSGEQLKGYATLDTCVSTRRQGRHGERQLQRKLTNPDLRYKRYLRTNMFLAPEIDTVAAYGAEMLKYVTHYDAMFVSGTSSGSFEDSQRVTTYPLDGEAAWSFVAENWGCEQTGKPYPIHVTDDESLTIRRMQGPACSDLRAAIFAKPHATLYLAQNYGLPVPPIT